MTQARTYLEETEDCLFRCFYDRGSRTRNEVELVSDLASPWEGTRVATLREIGRMEVSSKGLIHAMIACLTDENRDVRAEAATSIAKFGEQNEGDDCSYRLYGRREPRVRARAARALGKLPFDPAMLSYFEMGLKDENRTVVYETVGAIGNQSPATAKLLEKLRPVMKQAIVADGDRMATQVINAMLKMTTEPELTLRHFFEDDEELQRLALYYYSEVRSEASATTPQ